MTKRGPNKVLKKTRKGEPGMQPLMLDGRPRRSRRKYSFVDGTYVTWEKANERDVKAVFARLRKMLGA